eukprot:TRINITY_DN11920_c0_g1_i1.p1 TRINITY_DN11920_c0_g1~~TRINITY_DN11920_c0_g1_i1.p1  ORF type:complete len:265 (+),score=103.00 TRINITY_DN11920_c0_g1_i1:237-1031(+)
MVDRYQSRDGDSEYIRLSQQVDNTIYDIRRQVKNLDKIVGVIGTRRESPNTLSQMKTLIDDIKEQIRETTMNIKQLGQMDGGSMQEKKTRGMEQKKLRRDLEAVAQQFKTTYKQAIAKEQSTAQRERAESMAGGYDDYNTREDQSLLDDDRRQQQMMAAEVDIRTAQIHEREQGVRELESQMTEVNDIFKDLATIVQEQGDQLDSIESSLTTTYDRVDGGVEQLTRASHYQKKARNKAMCLLVIVVVVAAILAIVIVEVIHNDK